MSIKCGHCQEHHDTIAEVRECSRLPRMADIAAQFRSEAAATRSGASREELRQRRSGYVGGNKQSGYQSPYPGAEYGHEPHTAGWDAQRSWGKAAAVELVDGIYRNPATGDIFKVYHTVHGRNVQVTKRLRVLTEQDQYSKIVRGKDVLVKAEFVYEGTRGLVGLTPEMKMTLEQAKEYGAVYGVCVRCAATLTKEESIERAMGSTCASYFNA
jgi:hypothetical protein